MKHKGSPLKFCNCRMCKYGRKHYGNPLMIDKLKRKIRRYNKILLKQNKFDQLIEKISVPYTD